MPKVHMKKRGPAWRAQAIREFREEQGLSQDELGRRSDMTQEMVSRLERGYRTARIDELDRFARALGITVTQLVARGDPQA